VVLLLLLLLSDVLIPVAVDVEVEVEVEVVVEVEKVDNKEQVALHSALISPVTLPKTPDNSNN
jgi:hypothetical protein